MAMESSDPIIFDEMYKVFIYTVHGYAIVDLDQHLRKEYTLSPTQRKRIKEIYAH